MKDEMEKPIVPRTSGHTEVEIVEPPIVKTVAPPSSTEPPRTNGTHIHDLTTPNGHRVRDVTKSRDRAGSSAGADGERRLSSPQIRSQSQLSQHTSRSSGAQDPDSEFPWDISKRKSSYISMDATSATMHDMRRKSTAGSEKELERKRKRFLWWRHLVTRLQDNRVVSPEAAQELLSMEQQMQNKTYRKLKKVMNAVFLGAGVILLLAVIVILIYTDYQFNESMKALTVFLAGRRQGIW